MGFRPITLANAVSKLLNNTDLIISSHVYKSKHKKFRILQKDVYITLSNGMDIMIHKGFIWDNATVPKWLWSFIRPIGDFELAALIHDYLYITRTGTRKEADEELLKWSMVINDNKFDNYFRYIAVRALGWLYWWDFVKPFDK